MYAFQNKCGCLQLMISHALGGDPDGQWTMDNWTWPLPVTCNVVVLHSYARARRFIVFEYPAFELSSS